MTQQGIDLNSVFNMALQAMSEHREEVNQLDGYNGNHGDNMVQNLQLILNAVQDRPQSAPAEALRHASARLREAGRGSTSQYYAQGLQQASQQLQGRQQLGQDDVVQLLQSLLGAIPSEGHTEPQPQAPNSVLGQLLGGLTQQAAPQQQPQTQPQASGGMLGQLLGGLTQATQQPQAQPQPQAQDGKMDMGGMVDALLPAGLAFLQAKRSGADNMSAAGQALTQALFNQPSTPSSNTTPRVAAGTIIAQSVLKNLLGG